MLQRLLTAVVIGALTVGVVTPAVAQDWRGPYAGASLGRSWIATSDTESVAFDTSLDGGFDDIVRTVAGVDAFSPGFCGGAANSALAVDGCEEDDGGLDLGGRFGYDWQWGRLVVGGVGEISRSGVTDAVTAFSTTPAFYTFARKPGPTLGLRGRVGVDVGRWLVYGTAGPAWSRIRQGFATSNAANLFVPRSTEDPDDEQFVPQGVWGVQAGAGVEVRVGTRWTVVGEYLHATFDNRDDAIVRATRGTAPVTNPFLLVNANGTDLRRTSTMRLGTVRAGLNYRF